MSDERGLQMDDNTGSNINQEQLDFLQGRMVLANQLKRGANWFYWIAGLSLVNSVTSILGVGLNFLIGLGITQLIDGTAIGLGNEIAPDLATILKVVAFVLNLGVAAVFVVFGVLAGKGRKWAFVVGMVLYALDGLIFLLAREWLSIGFHLFALWGLYGGVRAISKLNEVESSQISAA
jgi:hypothetical protein